MGKQRYTDDQQPPVSLEAFLRAKIEEGHANGRPVSEKVIEMFRRRVQAAPPADLETLWRHFWGDE